MKPFILWNEGEKPNDALCKLNNVYIQNNFSSVSQLYVHFMQIYTKCLKSYSTVVI